MVHMISFLGLNYSKLNKKYDKNTSVRLMCVGASSKATCSACNFNWFLFTPGQAQSTKPFLMTLGLLKILWGRHPHRQPASQKYL